MTPTRTDWDVFALDERSQPTTGCTEPSPAGVQVVLAYNWVQLHQDATWSPAALTPRPVVATIYEGECQFQDVALVISRGPCNGVYVAAWFDYGQKVVGMVGLSCYGYLDRKIYSGVTQECVAFLQEQLRDWVQLGRVPISLGEIDFRKGLRFNQGDHFVAAGIDAAVACTPVGQAEPPQARDFLANHQSPGP